jgi:hypothetical protein
MDNNDTQISIKFKNIDLIPVTYGNAFISVKPYISLDSKVRIIKKIIETQKDIEVISGYFSSKYQMILGILEENTNLNTKEFADDIYKLDNLLASGLWEIIKSKITNFAEVEDDISKISEIYNKQNSAESNFNVLVKKVTELVTKISQVNLDPESIKNLIATLQVEANKIRQIVPVVKPEETSPEVLPIEQPKKTRKPRKNNLVE